MLETALLDEIIQVPEAKALETSRRIMKQEGLLAGISSGAACWAALQVAGRPENKGRLIVAVFPDGAERYFTTGLFS